MSAPPEAAVGKLLIATTNPNKLREIRPLLLASRASSSALPTFARSLSPMRPGARSGRTRDQGARLCGGSGLIAVAEDSGLVIDAMDGEPGVWSARFMGASTPYPERFKEIFRRLDGRDRTARFVTALAVARGHEILFETETAVEGEVAREAAGGHGFGYDPIFWYPPFGAQPRNCRTRKSGRLAPCTRLRDLRRYLAHEQT